MKAVLSIKDVTLGAGRSKICVSVTGATKEEIVCQSHRIKELHTEKKVDLVEWRADCFEPLRNGKCSPDEVVRVLEQIRAVCANMPCIFTIRTTAEGGNAELEEASYRRMIRTVMESQAAEIVDIELTGREDFVTEVKETAVSAGVYVLASYHNFSETPSKETMRALLQKMEVCGADLAKIAVMPTDTMDVLHLLEVTAQAFGCGEEADAGMGIPIITISMGKEGIFSRISGGLTGSAMTFAALEKGSAPGQLSAEKMKDVLELLESYS